jgi:hypothetical protein
LNSVRIFLAIVAAGVLCGCAQMEGLGPSSGKIRLTVDFQKGHPLKYRFRSSRDIAVDWGEMPGKERGKGAVNKSSEALDMVISFTPVEVNPYGLTTIKADCEGAHVTRSGPAMRNITKADAAEGFAGKSWTFTVGPTGKMEDRSNLLKVIRQVGQGAFREDRSQGVIKEPDMMYDFIASQWFLWDSISSIPRPTAGVKVGEIWKSKLLIPAPMILVTARDVNYKLQEVKEDPNGRIAVINGSYTFEYPSPSDWPPPYTETFQMSGTFGFLRGYRVTSLQGEGQEFFNIDAGRTEKYTQKYTVNVLSFVPLGLAINPKIKIEQTLTMELVTEERKN